jgi:hypothetical protein
MEMIIRHKKNNLQVPRIYMEEVGLVEYNAIKHTRM